VKCPHCNTTNDPKNTVCENCGQPLSGIQAAETQNTGEQRSGQQPARPPALANSMKELLGIMTVRTVVVLFGLWLVNLILKWLPFVEEMQIPGLEIRLPVLITSAIYLVIAFVLIGFVQSLRVLWPKSYPQASELGSVLAALVYLGILVAVYYAFRPLIRVFTADPDAMTIFQAVLFVIALGLIIPALITLYQNIPRWMAAIRHHNLFEAGNQIACLTCGHINQADQIHCSHCGAKLLQTA
jgi:hypothetical protein